MKENLILVPGLLCDARVWRDQVTALAGLADVAVADISEGDSLEVMAARILHEAPPYFCLAGHSLGGRVAMEIYRQAPDRVLKLALLSTGRRDVRPGEPERRAALVEAARTKGVTVIADDMLIPAMHPDKQRDAQLVEDVRAMIGRFDLEILKRQFTAMLSRPDMTEAMGGIACPTLIACGRQDTYSPLDRHEAMHEIIPGSRLVAIENAGHMAPMEEPEQVTEAMRAWLEG